MSERILIITKEPDDCQAAKWLEAAGQVVECATREAALMAPPQTRAIVVEAPSDTGAAIRTCRVLRAERRFAAMPLLIVAHDAFQIDIYEAFAAGANDFLLYRQIDARELLLRLRVHMRRAARRAPRRRYQLEGILLDLEAQRVVVGEHCSPLTPREAAILSHLAGRGGSPATTEEILVDALGYPPRRGNPEVVRTHVRHLREKLEPDPAQPRFLINVPRVGYKLAVGLEAE